MIHISMPAALVKEHIESVMHCIKRYYNEAQILAYVQELGISSIEAFLGADVTIMRKWVAGSADKLQFSSFKDLYSRYFSNGGNKYVYQDYNAYKFLKMLNQTVCPYCEDEYMDIVADASRRTYEIDHFFPKSKYPALAMNIYNLVPSGQNCNGLKLEKELGSNPYEGDIEVQTWLYPDIPVGISMEAISPEKCEVKFHPQNGMRNNVDKLYLEERYKRHAKEAHRLLRNLQLYDNNKIEELCNLGLGPKEEIIATVFGPQDAEEKHKTLRQKMLKDITGY